jgi:hypothetical protein
MAVTIQLRRDTHSNLSGSGGATIAPGEIVIDTTNNRAVVNSTTGNLNYNTAITNNQFLTLDDGNGRILGGTADEVQLSVKGGSSQASPILQVTDSGGSNKILSVTDNDTTICTIENHGDTADKVVQIVGQDGQREDGSGGNLLEVITQADDSGPTQGVFVDNEGNVSITPSDGEGEQASLTVKGSSAGDADAKIFEVQDEGGNEELLVNDVGTTVSGTLTAKGQVVVQNGSTANQNVTLFGSGTESDKVITVDDDGTENFSVNAGGKIDSKDMEISATGRTIADASVVRADELIANVFKNIKDVSATAAVTNSDSDFPIGGMRPWEVGGNVDGNSNADITFALLGDSNQDSNQSLANAPAGKYLVLGFGIHDRGGDTHVIKTPSIAIIDHTTGSPTTVFTISSNRGSFGIVTRLT